MDIGPGSFGALWRYVDPHDVDALLVSHGHADHLTDVISYHVFLKWHPGGPKQGLPTYGPAEIRDRVSQIDGYDEDQCTLESFRFHTVVHGSEFKVGPMNVTAYRGLHPVDSYGFRVEGPSSADAGRPVVVAYTGDTDRCDEMVQMAKGADLLLAEAGFTSDVEIRGIHLSGERAGKLALDAKADHLVLTHIQPWTDPQIVEDEARTVYPGWLSVARPGDTWLV